MDGMNSAFLRDLLYPAGGASGRPGILYVDDFDEAIPEPGPLPETAEPMFCAAELEAARQAGIEAGTEAARRGDAALQEQLRTACLQAIADGLASTRADAAAIAEGWAAEIASTLLTTLAACLPALMARYAETELASVMQAVLPPLQREGQLMLRVHPELVEFASVELGRISADLASCARLIPDLELPRGDVRLAWSDGSASRDTMAIWQNVRRALGLFADESLKELSNE